MRHHATNLVISFVLLGFFTRLIYTEKSLYLPTGDDEAFSNEDDDSNSNSFGFLPSHSSDSENQNLQDNSIEDLITTSPKPVTNPTNQTSQKVMPSLPLSHVNPQKLFEGVEKDILFEANHTVQLIQYFKIVDQNFKNVDKRLEKLHSYLNETNIRINKLVKKIHDKFEKTNTGIQKKFDKGKQDLNSFKDNSVKVLRKDVSSNKSKQKREIGQARDMNKKASKAANTQGKTLLNLVKQLSRAG